MKLFKRYHKKRSYQYQQKIVIILEIKRLTKFVSSQSYFDNIHWQHKNTEFLKSIIQILTPLIES